MEKIKIVFLSSYLSMHQIDICKSFLKRPDVIFSFVSSSEPKGFKTELGSHDNNNLPFVIRSYESPSSRSFAIKVCHECDLLIVGSGDNSLYKGRKKIVFRYSEHFDRKFSLLIPLKKFYYHFKYSEDSKNGFLLCSSSHSKHDFQSCLLFLKKCLYYGYFPRGNSGNPCFQKFNDIGKRPFRILWAGRGVALKHPEYAFLAAKELTNRGYLYTLKVVGDSSLIDKLKEKNAGEPFMNNMLFCGTVSNENMLSIMQDADIFLFCSDKREGWGATLNEAMSSGCCCIANSKAGATSFLIEHRNNGLVYRTKKQFLKNVVYSLQNPTQTKKMGILAKKTIEEKWNSDTAVSNIVSVFQYAIAKKPFPDFLINNGPGTLIAKR